MMKIRLLAVITAFMFILTAAGAAFCETPPSSWKPPEPGTLAYYMYISKQLAKDSVKAEDERKALDVKIKPLVKLAEKQKQKNKIKLEKVKEYDKKVGKLLAEAAELYKAKTEAYDKFSKVAVLNDPNNDDMEKVLINAVIDIQKERLKKLKEALSLRQQELKTLS